MRAGGAAEPVPTDRPAPPPWAWHDGGGRDQPQRPGARRWALLTLLLLLVIPVGLVLALPWLAEPGLRAGLRAAGVEGAAFERLNLGLWGAEVRDLRLDDGAGLTLERLALVYSPVGLARGRLEAVRLDGLVLRGRLDESGLHLSAVDRLVGDAGAGAGEAVTGLALPRPERVEVRSGRLELATPWGPLLLPFEATARPLNGDRLGVEAAVAGGSLALATSAVGGSLAADAELTAEVALGALPAADAVRAEGVLALTASGLELPGIAAGIEGGGPVHLALADGRLTLDARGLVLTAPTLGTDPPALVGPAPLTLTLGGADAPLRIVLDDLRAPPPTLTVAGRATLAGTGPRVEATIDATLASGANGAAFDLAPSTLALTATDLRWDDLRLRRSELELTAEGRSDALRGTLELDLVAEGEAVPGLHLEDARLRLPAEAAFEGDRLTLRPRAGGQLAAGGFRWGDALRGEAIELDLGEAAGPLLDATFERGALTDWRHRLALAPAPFTATVELDGELLTLRGTTPQFDLELAASGVGRALLADAAVDIPGYGLALAGLDAELRLAAGGLDPGASVPVRIASLRHTGDPPSFGPLALRGVLRPDSGRVAFQAELGGADAALQASAEGRYDPATGAGQAELRVAPLAFAPDGLQPGQLAPRLAAVASDATGRVAVGGRVAWGPGAPASDLVVLMQDLGFTAGPARFERVNGAVTFDSLFPPATPPDQLVAVALVDLGLPLVDGIVGFRLDRDGALAVDQARWSWAGGEIGAGPFVHRPGRPLELVLEARGLDMERLLEQVQLGGLEGTGTLSGTLPLRVENGEVVVRGGELRTRGPGRLRYRPRETPAALAGGGQGVDLMLQALENFHYETLRITLDGRTDGEMDVGLHVSGANPDLYGGYPVEFNLNLEGRLGAILQAGLEGYRLPERIADRMEQLGR